MNDFDYDILMKKRVASGARYKKGGSKSKRCTLPSDYLTPAQLKKKNGGIFSMNMKQPIKWDDFNKMSPDLQREYLKDKVNQFSALVAKDVAAMFGISAITLNKRVEKLGMDRANMWVNGRPKRADRKAFRDWVNEFWPTFEWEKDDSLDNQIVSAVKIVKEEPSEKPTMITDIAPVVVSNEIVKEPAKRIPMSVSSLAMSFVGKLNIDQISNTILSVAKDKNVLVKIVVEEVAE